MCIMEVRAGQRTSTIAQAMAHNVSTIERDLDLLEPLLVARGETECLTLIQHAHGHMKQAYERFLEVFAHEIGYDVAHGHEHDHGNYEQGHERTQEAILSAVHAAQVYETR